MEASVLSLVVIPLSFGYAISKYKLMDVDLIFQRGAAYVLASSALFAFYVGLILLIAKLVHDFSSQSGFLLLAGAALVVAFLFAPLKDRIQEQLDRSFYKDRYGYRRSFASFGRDLGIEINLTRLTKLLLDRIQKTLDVAPVAIFLRGDEVSSQFHLEAMRDLKTLDLPASVVLSEKPVPPRDRLTEGAMEVREKLYRWGIRYVEPLTVRGRLVGFLALGRRTNGDFLTSEDLEMLATIAGYAAIAIDNALLYRSLELKASELSRLRIYSENVIESINLGVAVISPEGSVTVWNSAMAAVTGRQKSSVLGRPLSEALPSGLTEAMRGILDGPGWLVEGPRRLYKTHLDKAHGETRLVNITLAPFVSHEDVNTGTLMICDDVTEKVQLESQLQQAEKLSSIGLFAAGLAHEVNTPLAGISSYAQMLLSETPEGDSRREYLEKIERQSFRASEIINNLLKFTRFSDSEFDEISINSLMMETLSLLEHQFKRGEVDIELDLDPSLPRTIGNGGKLQQVFMNLFLNAKDAMPEGGRLKLRTYTSDSNIVVQVSDTGVGISREDIKKIYDPFFTTKSVGKGTGLGLSVSYGIIQEHSGHISVESSQGTGTTFSLHFPVKRVN
jgi:PAS domain S-box-containing protein